MNSEPCRMPGRPCPREGTVLVRIADIGTRRLCQEDVDWLRSVGAAVRVLPPETPIPEWRLRSLAKVMSGERRRRVRVAAA